MTTVSPLASLAFQQAFLKLDLATRMWIQMKAQMIASIGRFGPTEINLFKQQVITRFGTAATTGSPSLLEIAIWYVLRTMQTSLSSLGTGTQATQLTLQNTLQQQQQTLQTLSNVSRLLHDTALSTIQNLR